MALTDASLQKMTSRLTPIAWRFALKQMGTSQRSFTVLTGKNDFKANVVLEKADAADVIAC